MHDLDRTLRSYESENEMSDFEEEIFSDSEGDFTQEITEEQEIDLASELLAVSDERELDQFLGGLLKKAKSALSPLKKYIKPLIKKAIPFAGKAVGGFFGGPAGAAIGGKIGSFASTLFEADFESMEPGEQEMEVARRVVRLATSAAANAGAASGTANPAIVARKALIQAAQTHAPGMLRQRGSATSGRGNGSVSSVADSTDGGRWIRRGGRIVLLGV